MKSKVYFNPWIGDNYDKRSPKILVIGDSHYCGECNNCGVRGMAMGEIVVFVCAWSDF